MESGYKLGPGAGYKLRHGAGYKLGPGAGYKLRQIKLFVNYCFLTKPFLCLPEHIIAFYCFRESGMILRNVAGEELSVT